MKKTFKRILLSIGVLIMLFAGYYFLIRKLDADVMEAKDFNVSSLVTANARVLPSVFINGERFYIKFPAANGDTVLGFGDSGGGISMALPAVIEKLHLKSRVKTGLLKGLMPLKYIPYNDLVKDSTYPSPELLRSMILRHPFSWVREPFLLIPPMNDELKFIAQSMPLDIFLGQNFFMGKAWTIDYINRQILVNTPISMSEAGMPGVQKLGFKKNKNQEKVYGHPSMEIEVDGELIEVLFDTGATMVLSEEGKAAIHTAEKTIGGSFIARSIFDKWRQKHPDWKYYKAADKVGDVIEVPKIKIGGYEAGPVLFAKRNDENWSEGMIHTMDKVVKGAIGGSALKYFKVVIDYNSELIRFKK